MNFFLGFAEKNLRTVSSSGRISGEGGCLVRGGVCSGGVCSGGVSALWGGVCSPGVGGIPACTEADTPTPPPPRGQIDACKNITFATSLRTVKISTITSLTH